MTELHIGNSESQLKNLPIAYHQQIKQVLSYEVEDRRPGSKFFKQRRYLIDKHGNFPTGLLKHVKTWLAGQKNFTYSILDSRVRPIAQIGLFSAVMPYKPYPEQTDAVEVATKSDRGIISAPTGLGKSAIIALLIQKRQVPTLVIVPNLELKRQLTESLTQVFGGMRNISVENIDSSSLDKDTKKYGMLILDEAHHSAAKTYRVLNKKKWHNIFYRYCLTATPFRSQEEEQILMESVTGQVLYAIPYAHAVRCEYIVPMDAFYIEIPKLNNRKYTKYANAYKELIVQNQLRNEIIVRLMVQLYKTGSPTLTLIKEIEHGKALSCEGAFPFVSGQNDQKHLISQFADGHIPVLLGTYGVVGEGCDTKACEYVIIATPVKSKNLFMQMVGRSFRKFAGKESAKIILIKDDSNRWFKDAFREQCRILLDEYGIVPIRLEL